VGVTTCWSDKIKFTTLEADMRNVGYTALEEQIPPLKTALIWRQNNTSFVLHQFITVVRQMIIFEKPLSARLLKNNCSLHH